MPKIGIPLKDRFYAKIVKGESPDECWNWTAFVNPGGYGVIGVGKKAFVAHRISWEIHNGPIPEGMLCLHKCNNRICTNPKHLYIGNYSDNMYDAWRCGNKKSWALSDPKGEKGNRRLMPKDRKKLFRRYFDDEWLQNEIAEELDVAVMTVSIFMKGKWAKEEMARRGILELENPRVRRFRILRKRESNFTPLPKRKP